MKNGETQRMSFAFQSNINHGLNIENGTVKLTQSKAFI